MKRLKRLKGLKRLKWSHRRYHLRFATAVKGYGGQRKGRKGEWEKEDAGRTCPPKLQRRWKTHDTRKKSYI